MTDGRQWRCIVTRPIAVKVPFKQKVTAAAAPGRSGEVPFMPKVTAAALMPLCELLVPLTSSRTSTFGDGRPP